MFSNPVPVPALPVVADSMFVRCFTVYPVWCKCLSASACYDHMLVCKPLPHEIVGNPLFPLFIFKISVELGCS